MRLHLKSIRAFSFQFEIRTRSYYKNIYSLHFRETIFSKIKPREIGRKRISIRRRILASIRFDVKKKKE